jgi:hypothetical protein
MAAASASEDVDQPSFHGMTENALANRLEPSENAKQAVVVNLR